MEAAAPWSLAPEREGEDGAAAALDAVLTALVDDLSCLVVQLDPLVPSLAGRVRAALTPGDDGRLPAPRLLAPRLSPS